FGGDVNLGPDAGLPALPLTGDGVVNLEGPIGPGPSTPQRLMNGAPSLGGVRVAWVENNHADDDGEAGRQRTLEALKSAGIAAAGTAVVQRVVFLGVDLQKGLMAADLEAARAQGDVLVVGLHVTAPPLLLPTPELEVA